MKRILLLFAALICMNDAYAQKNKTSAVASFNFENNSAIYYAEIYRDTISNPNCIWQIGNPSKNVFDSAFSYPNAIVTDTVNSYPINDTSSFIIAQRPLNGWKYPFPYCGVRGFYKVNSDSLTDYGMLEISIDNGSNWIDVLTDTQYHFFDSTAAFNTKKPVFTGNSDGWQEFIVNFSSLADSFSIKYSDTILLRFTFISDSIQTNKDGLMFDNIWLDDWYLSVKDQQKNSLPLKAFPNPAKHSIFLREEATLTYSRKKLVVRDVMGREMMRGDYSTETIRLDVSALPPGIYAYQVVYDDGKYQSLGNFIKQ